MVARREGAYAPASAVKTWLRIACILAMAGGCLALGAAAGASNPNGVAGPAAADVPERSPSIVGGSVAAAGAWPWMVRLDLRTPDGILFPTLDGQPDVDLYCGGSLIGERWVVDRRALHASSTAR